MMKQVYAALVATVLGFATVGGALAIDSDDVQALSDLTTAQGADHKEAVIKYIADQGEEGYVYEGEKGQKFAQGLMIFGGMPVPPGTESIVFGEPDGEGDVLVSVFDGKGTFLGAAWFNKTLVDSAADYAKAGL